jgi:cyanophycin synthetase
MMNKRDIVIERIAHLRGPNIWTVLYVPIIEAVVNIGELENCPSDTVPSVYKRLTEWMPSLIEHRCSPGVRGGFLTRLERGTWPGHILEHVALELQNMAGMRGGFGRTRETSTTGVYKVVITAWNEEVAKAALYAGRDVVMAAYEDRDCDIATHIEHLKDLMETHFLGPSTATIVEAAKARRIPTIRLSSGNLLQLGYGARQRRIWTAETEKTGAIAETTSRDKDLTKSLLEACGVPIPHGRSVDSADDAWEAAQDLGMPVVVKPLDGNHGRGVFTNLISQQEVQAAYDVARQEGSGVLVEKFIYGDEHRLLIVGGKLVAAAKGRTASITGDGKSTVEELIESQINADPRRGRNEDHPLNFIRLDSANRLEIAKQGLTPEAIPTEGRVVIIQRSGNVAIDCTDEVHPEVADTAAMAARIVGLDVAGIDLVAQDISQPLQTQAGAIVEVNAGPGLLMHIKPAEGQPRPVGQAIVDHMFGKDETGLIPLVGVCGSHGVGEFTRLLFQLLSLNGWETGMASSSGLVVGKRQLEQKNSANFDQGRRLLLNREVQAAIIETTGVEILTNGLPYEVCDVGVVTRVEWSEDFSAFDLHNIEDNDDLIKVYRTQVDVVLPTGVAVLNADDTVVASLAGYCEGSVTFYSLNPQTNPTIATHIGLGHKAVVLEHGQVVLIHGNQKTPLMMLEQCPSLGPQASETEKSALLAVAASAWALGLSIELIEAGLISPL